MSCLAHRGYTGHCLLCHAATVLSPSELETRLWQELGWGSSCCSFRRGWCSPSSLPPVHGAIGSEEAELTVQAGHSLRSWWAFVLAWPVHLLGFPPSSSITHAAGVASGVSGKAGALHLLGQREHSLSCCS